MCEESVHGVFWLWRLLALSARDVRGNCDGICRGLDFYSGFCGFFVQMPFSSISHVFDGTLLFL